MPLSARAKRAASVALRVVEAKRLFVQVAEQMERFDAHVGALHGALQERPEVLQAVGVDLPVHVGFGVVDDVVDVAALSSRS